ncbi:MAG TPA: hypothetical protein VKU41_31000, partial [Polyangiaceae bacterium]|nr:hypothetical protein [Polyangiaceae bacterium]
MMGVCLLAGSAATQACAARLPPDATPIPAVVVRWEEKTTAVATCQVAPGEWSSQVTIRDTDVDWPGRALAAQLPERGSEVSSLADALRRRIVVPLRAEPAQETSVSARFAGVVAGPRGKSLVFDVRMHANSSDAGMCHRWTMDADLSGVLRLRADDGSLETLDLSGLRRD